MRDKILDGLLHLSDRQFDPIAKEKVREIIGLPDEEAKKKLLFLVDDCVYGSLSSSFEIKVLDVLYRQAGGSDEEMEELKEERLARHEN
jgi:hypothetical protein